MKRHWTICPTCAQLVLAQNGIGSHKCPEAARAKREAEIDMAVDDDMQLWDLEVDDFWSRSDVKFMSYLAEKERNDS